MAVVTRMNAKGQKIYWIAFYDANREQQWERVGSDKQAAKRLDDRRKREVKAGTYARAHRPTMPFGEWLADWAAKRTNRNAKDDRRLIALHLLSIEWLRLLPCEDMRPRHHDQLVEELKAKISEETGRPLSEKYVSNLYGLFRTCCQDARRAELMAIDPCVLRRGLLRRKSKRGIRVPYEPGDVLQLLNVEDPEAAAWVTLAFLTGAREGEVCGFRWRCWDRHSVPLGCLHLVSQYDDQPLKTEKDGGIGEHARNVPVLPELERFLTWWWETGFEFVYCRRPTLYDFIVPRTKDGKNHTKSSAYKLWRKACDATGVENRTLHATRHTFVSYCARGGSRREVTERVTHNACGFMVDHYTAYDWEPLCDAVFGFARYLDKFLDRNAGTSEKRLEEGWRRRESKSALVLASAGDTGKNTVSDDPPGHVKNRRTPHIAAGSCASQEPPTATHPLPPGLVAVRVETLDGQVERVVARRWDDVRTLSERVRAAAHGLAAWSES